MKVTETALKGCFIIEPTLYQDSRGYFMETYNGNLFNDAIGETINFVQDNESRSTYGVIRGLHFQEPPYAQSKLVRVVEGAVLDVAVDLRKNSATYGKHISVKLSSDNKLQLFVPKGFAHGYSVLSDHATFAYKCDEFYHRQSESGIHYNDPDLDIDWQITAGDELISDKDRKQPSFKSLW